MSRVYGFLLEFIPMKIGAGMTSFEAAQINCLCEECLTSPRKAGLRAGRRNAFMHEACSLRQALRRTSTLPLIARNGEVKASNAFVLLSFKYRFSFLQEGFHTFFVVF